MGMTDQACHEIRFDAVQDIEQVVPTTATIARVDIWEVTLKSIIFQHELVAVVHTQLLIFGAVDRTKVAHWE